MKIVLPLGGDDVADHMHNIYHRIIKDNEPIITTFNGVTVIFFPDENEFEHARYADKPFRQSIDMNAIKAHYLHTLEAKDPSGYTEVQKYYDEVRDENVSNRKKIKAIKGILNNWQYIDDPQQIITKIIEGQK